MSVDGLEEALSATTTMLPFDFRSTGRPLHVLCLGAHSDDIEIGCAGTLMRWAAERCPLVVTWVVFSAEGVRATEARRSARALLGRGATLEVVLGGFTDARLPQQVDGAKDLLFPLARRCSPDVILTHHLEDRHQDHRCVAELTWQTWRNHTILEYEIAKYEGDLGRPNLYVPLADAVAERKLRHLARHFPSQGGKDWFRPASFRGLMALRGLECRAPAGMAEAFHLRKAVI